MDINVYFDGEDWIHLWDGGCLVHPQRKEDPVGYCLDNIDLFTKNYTPKLGDIVIDLGSGVGTEIAYFSNLVGDSGKVYAIEADPFLHRKNLKVVDLLKLKNVVCLNLAITDKPGTVNLGIVSEDGVDSSIHINNSPNTISVRSESLDSLFKQQGINNVDYIKINIEGAEKETLIGATAVLNKIKNWCISTHDFCGFYTKSFVVNYFNSLGIFVKLHEEVEGRPWMGGYVYVKQ